MADSGRTGRPASGERRAVRNLSAQYRVAALLTYRALLAGDLDWIRMVDPEAGRLDDVVIARTGRLDAYQIKWSEFQAAITFRALITASKVSGTTYPAPIELMADGWRRLRAAHPSRHVRPHYLCRDIPSVSDAVPGHAGGGPAHHQAFMRSAFKERARWKLDFDGTFAAWKGGIEALAAAAAMASVQGDEFHEFIANCELDLGFELPLPSSAREQGEARDVEALADFLMRQVADGGSPVELRPEDILRGLRWTDRLELRHKHEFPVDERLYRPIGPTVDAIGKAIGTFRSGYVALVGPPGSGKSTTLMRTLRYREGIRLVRYFAYVRDDPREGREDAAAFLHDLCLQLQSLAAGEAGRSAPTALHELRERVGELLAEIAVHGGDRDVRTVILVDGLDHVGRRQGQARSLLDELPSPEAIPEGVLFILGTQLVGLQGRSAALGPIRSHLAAEGRTVRMERLPRASVHSIVRAAVPEELLRSGDLDLADGLSGGHPLSLAYLVKRLAVAADRGAASRMLDSGGAFGGDVFAGYDAYWDGLADDADVRGLLALLCRIRGPIDLSAVSRLASHDVLERFQRTAGYLFREITPRRWAFFHDSFRQYLLRGTSVDPFGQPDPGRDAGLHLRLAEIAGERDAPTSLAWDRLHHLEQAGQHERLLDHARQALFRHQFMAGRPAWQIVQDILRALHAAARAGDVIATLRLLLIHQEIQERKSALETIATAELAVDCAEADDLETTLLADDGIAVPDAVALKHAGLLMEAGRTTLASRLFDAAEPADLLTGVHGVHPGDDVLAAWATVAWRFRPVGEILGAIGNLKAHRGPSRDLEIETEDPETDARMRAETIVALGIAMLDASRPEEYANLLASVDGTAMGRRASDLLRLHAARRSAAGETTGVDPVGSMLEVVSSIPPSQAGREDALLIADTLARLPDIAHLADDYLAALPGTVLGSEIRRPRHDGLGPLENLFRQARALAARGRPLDPTLVPAAAEERDEGRALIRRLVISTATLWGEVFHGGALTPAGFLRRLEPLLAFRRRESRVMLVWHDWSAIDAIHEELCLRILMTAEAHGPAVFQSVLQAFASEWRGAGQADALGWSVERRRSLLMAAFSVDGDVDTTTALLEALDDELSPSLDLHVRLEELERSARAWLELGRRDKARDALLRIHGQSFGIHHHKDRQIQDWVAWAGRLVEDRTRPDRTLRALDLLVKLVAQLYVEGRGRGASDATWELLGHIARLDPEHAHEVGKWLLRQGAADWSAVIGGLLIVEVESGDARRVSEALVAAARLLLPIDEGSTDMAAAVGQVAGSPLAFDPAVVHALDALHRTAASTAVCGDDYLAAIRHRGRPLPADEKRDRGSGADPGGADSRQLVQAEMEVLAGRPAELVVALRTCAPAKELDWKPILGRLSKAADRAAARQAGLLLPARLTSPAELHGFVLAASAAGAVDLAEAATRQVVEIGQPPGWTRSYDGGSRLWAVRCLQVCDPVHGIRRSLELFVSDYVGASMYPGSLLHGLQELVEALDPKISVHDAWAEIDEHLMALTDLQENGREPPSRVASNPRPPTTNPINLLLDAMVSPAMSLAWSARRGLVDVLSFGDPTGRATDGLREALGADYSGRCAAMATLGCLASKHPTRAVVFARNVEPLAWDEAAGVRLAAQDFLAALGRHLPPAPRRRPLPAYYRLHVPEAFDTARRLGGDAWRPGEPLRDTDDPYDLTHHLHPPLRMLAAASGLGFDLLVRRTAALAADQADSQTWSAAAERRLSSLLEATGLRLNYRRPRAQVVEQAFGTLVCELCDGGALRWPVEEIEHFIAICDPPVNMAEAVAKPEWLQSPGKRDWRVSEEKWLEAVAESLSDVHRMPDGGVVLCEYTRFVVRGRDRLEERRLSLVAHRTLELGHEKSVSLGCIPGSEAFSGRRYPSLPHAERAVGSVVVSGGFLLASSDFVALDPAIGFHLGWRKSAEGLFRWIDVDGEIMVESHRWARGNVALHERGSPDATAGGGWLVVATPKAWQVMRPGLANFVRHRKAGRLTALERDGSRGSRTITDTLPVP